MNASAVPILECSGLERRFGGLVAVTGVDLRIDRGEIFGLVGPNGSGKTTLVNAITGFYPPQKGRIVLEGADITAMKPHLVAKRKVARTFQNLALFNGMSVLDNILLGRHVHLKPSVAKTALYWWLGQPQEIAHRRVCEEIIEFLQLQGVRDEHVEHLVGERGEEPRLVGGAGPHDPGADRELRRLEGLPDPEPPPTEDPDRVLVAGRAVVVVDEAYIDFADGPGLAAEIPANPNLIILRTLSKAYGLAGARVGTTIADPAVIAVLLGYVRMAEVIREWAARPGRHIVNLSGGKDSTALAIFLRDKLPRLEYVFCDTHKELPETYDYLDRLENFLGRQIAGFDIAVKRFGLGQMKNTLRTDLFTPPEGAQMRLL